MTLEQQPRQEQSAVMRGALWLLFKANFQAVEALASAGVLVLALFFSLASASFQTLPSFEKMRTISPDGMLYAGISGFLVTAHVLAAIFSQIYLTRDTQWLSRWRWVRIGVVMLIAGWWGVISTFVWQAVPRTPWPYLIFLFGGCGAGWCFLRLFARSDDI